MELIDKIKDALLKSGLDSPTFDLYYDKQNNIVGHISDTSFEGKSNEDNQKFIWTSLRKHLPPEDLLKILVIFDETGKQRMNRLFTPAPRNKNSKILIHQTRDLSKYWLIVDVAKLIDDWKSFFLIINEKYSFKKGLTFSYPNDVIEFMELKQGEIYEELFTHAYNSAESEIKIDLMNRHEKLANDGHWGNANIYSYVYDSFELKEVRKSELLFSPKEIDMLEEAVPNFNQFGVMDTIAESIKRSKELNELKQSFG